MRCPPFAAALWALGGVPEEHRTDSLSAAFKNLTEQEELTKRYADLCSHYGLRATRCNPGQSNENGSIESRNNSLKTALDQALRLRGSRSFDARLDYETFIDTIVQRMNTRAAKFLITSAPCSSPCGAPDRELRRFLHGSANTPSSTLKGCALQRTEPTHWSPVDGAPVCQHVEGWLGGQCVVSLPRARPAQGQRFGRSIDYRHLVGALKRKPGHLPAGAARCGIPRAYTSNVGATVCPKA